MSSEAMKWARSIKGLDSTAWTILKELAWISNDDFTCWPSQSTIAENTGYCRRVVNTVINRLCEIGLISYNRKQYVLNVRGVHDVHRNVHDVHNDESASDSQICAPDSQQSAPDAHPSKKEIKTNEKDIDGFSLPDWIDKNDWRDYLEMRAKLKSPMTDRAKEMAVTKLGKLKNQGFDPKDVLQQSVFRAWQGLFAPANSANPAENIKPINPAEISFKGDCVIVLSDSDFDEWLKIYGGSEGHFRDFLWKKDQWYSTQPPEFRRNWFSNTKKQIEAMANTS